MDTTNLKVYLPFDYSPTQDLIGNTWTANGNVEIIGTKANFDGASYLKMTELFEFTGQPFTICCKFSATKNTTSGAVALWQMYIGSSNRFQIGVTTAGKMEAYKDSGTINITSSATFFDGQEHHAECDFDGETWYFFVDGVLWGSKAHTFTAQNYTLYVGTNFSANRKFTGSIDEFMIYDGVALHTENFTPPTDDEYTNLKLDLGANIPVEKSFDVETSIRNAAKGWRVYNPGYAELIDGGGTTVTVDETQSIAGKAFYGGQLSDMFHTPDGLKEIWIRFDFAVTSNGDNSPRVGHWSNSSNKIFGLSGSLSGYTNTRQFSFNGTTVLPQANFNQIYHCLLHIKSDSTDGLVELTLDKENFTWTGNINGGEDLNNLVIRSTNSNLLFSNVVVSETQLTLEDGWHKRYFGVETKINAPVLNIRLRGENKKFPLNTKRDDKSLTVRVGNRNFYNTSVATTDSLAGSARFLLDDTARALQKG